MRWGRRRPWLLMARPGGIVRRVLVSGVEANTTKIFRPSGLYRAGLAMLYDGFVLRLLIEIVVYRSIVDSWRYGRPPLLWEVTHTKNEYCNVQTIKISAHDLVFLKPPKLYFWKYSSWLCAEGARPGTLSYWCLWIIHLFLNILEHHWHLFKYFSFLTFGVYI